MVLRDEVCILCYKMLYKNQKACLFFAQRNNNTKRVLAQWKHRRGHAFSGLRCGTKSNFASGAWDECPFLSLCKCRFQTRLIKRGDEEVRSWSSLFFSPPLKRLNKQLPYFHGKWAWRLAVEEMDRIDTHYCVKFCMQNPLQGAQQGLTLMMVMD